MSREIKKIIADITKDVKVNRLEAAKMTKQFSVTENKKEKEILWYEIRKCKAYESGIESTLNAFGYRIVDGDTFEDFFIEQL